MITHSYRGVAWPFWQVRCLVPVRRFPSPSRSIRFGDVSEANGGETASHFRIDHVTRNALAARKNEAYGLGKQVRTRVHMVWKPSHKIFKKNATNFSSTHVRICVKDATPLSYDFKIFFRYFYINFKQYLLFNRFPRHVPVNVSLILVNKLWYVMEANI